MGSPGGTNGKEATCQCRRHKGLIPRLAKSPGGGYGDWLQYSFLSMDPTDRGVWQATVHRVTQNQTPLKQFSMHTCRLIKR